MLAEEITPVDPNLASQGIKTPPGQTPAPVAQPEATPTTASTPPQLPAQPTEPAPAALDQKEAPAQDPNLLTNSGEAVTLWQKIQMNNVITGYRIIVTALTIQGLYGIYQSVKFIMIEYPELESQLASHLITQDQINSFASKAIIMVATTILSMFFALRISIIQSKIAKRINALIGVFLFFANTWIHNYLSKAGSAEIITQLFFSALDTIKQLLP